MKGGKTSCEVVMFALRLKRIMEESKKVTCCVSEQKEKFDRKVEVSGKENLLQKNCK